MSLADIVGTKPMSEEEKQATLQGEQKSPEVNEPPVGEDAPIEKAEEVKQEGQVEDQPKKESPKFELDAFNSILKEKFEDKTFESVDDVLKAVEKSSKFDDVSTKNEELTRLYEEAAMTAKKAKNPMDYFANKDEYIRQQFLVKNKDKYDEQSLNYLTRLTPSNINQLSDLDALTYDMLINNPTLDGGEAGAKELLMNKYNVDEDDLDELPRSVKNQIMIDGKAAKNSLTKLYEGIDIPEATSWEDYRNKTVESWQPSIEATVNGINELPIEEGFSFKVSSDMKEGLVEEAIHDIVMEGKELNEESLRSVAGRVREKLLVSNFDKVISAIRKDEAEKVKAQYRAEVHNDTPLNNDASPKGESPKKSLNDIALDKLRNR